jgi:hypothetical protein
MEKPPARMSLRPFIALAAALLFLPGCGKQTATEIAEAERAKIREEKRLDAIKVFNELATTFPDDPKAKDATAEAAQLTNAGPKK